MIDFSRDEGSELPDEVQKAVNGPVPSEVQDLTPLKLNPLRPPPKHYSRVRERACKVAIFLSRR